MKSIITEQDLMEYLNGLEELNRNPIEGYFMVYYSERKSKRESKLGYEMTRTMDALKRDAIRVEIQSIKKKINYFGKQKENNLVIVPSKLNYKPKF
tara:strand:- start:1216 stop:1503 length:288 start_codon:yes stop_codon:yes gene_type:complete